MVSPKISRHIPELDGLRGIAIAMVVLFHSRQVSMCGSIPFLYKALELGPNGVDLFFVLSGFLITGILLDTKGYSNYFGAFYARRALRILPLYFVAVEAFFWIELPYWQRRGLGINISVHDQVWYWSFLMNWHDAAGHINSGLNVLWSLGVEEQFYLFWPLIIFFCAARYFPAICVAIGCFSLGLRLVLSTGYFVAPSLVSEWIHRATLTRLDTLAIGALVAVVIRCPDWAQRARTWARVIAPACFLVWMLIWLNSEDVLQTLGYSISALGFACTVLVCVMNSGSNHLLCRIARGGVLRSMGRYSYAMYVLHMTVIRFVKVFIVKFVLPLVVHTPLVHTPILAVSLVALASCLAASYLAALASWNLLEKHFLRLKRLFPYRESVPVAMPASAD